VAAIRAQDVYKIFGEKPQIALKLLEEGKTKPEVQAETGQVVGVQDVSFQLGSGELFVIMGLSGSGKSTLLRCINRLVEPTSGEIYIESDGKEIEITRLSRKELRLIREKQMSMVFQGFALLPHRSVISNVTLGLEVQGVDKKERLDKARAVLELVGLEAWANSLPSQLSGGMQQRVGLARSLATEAEILLMDEPFSALDPLIKVHMQDELLKLQEKVRRTILFVTHDLDEALKIGDQIAIMEAGQIVQSGTPEEIIVNPRTEYVADFVEHADPTGVLTAGTIARTVSSDPDRFVAVGMKIRGVERALRARESDIVFCLDKDGRPIKAVREEKTLPIKRLGEKFHGVSRQDVIFAAMEDTTLREIMKARLSSSDNAVIILSQGGEFRGIITEQEILQGILEKGRKEKVGGGG
jgi:glycine betaine/proline transport system ATP-binding protein